jgi:hypothetical protein
MTGRRLRQLRAVSVLLLLVVLSNVAAWDHMLLLHDSEEPEAVAEHAAHCHYDPGGCASQSADVSYALDSGMLLALPDLVTTPLATVSTSYQSRAIDPETPPPRF